METGFEPEGLVLFRPAKVLMLASLRSPPAVSGHPVLPQFLSCVVVSPEVFLGPKSPMPSQAWAHLPVASSPGHSLPSVSSSRVSLRPPCLKEVFPGCPGPCESPTPCCRSTRADRPKHTCNPLVSGKYSFPTHLTSLRGRPHKISILKSLKIPPREVNCEHF